MRVKVQVACFLQTRKSQSQEPEGQRMHSSSCVDRDGFFWLLSAFLVSELREGGESCVRLM